MNKINQRIIKKILNTQFNDIKRDKNDGKFNIDTPDYDKKTENVKKIKIKKRKWNTLQHNGVKFPKEYIQNNVPLIYNGEKIILSKENEEIAFLYAKYIDTEYVLNNTFNKNFFNDWKKSLGKNNIIQNLSLCDFSLMKEYLNNEKEKKKELSEENNESKQLDDKYKYAIIDGKQETVGNYRMEPPALFIGRGKNPKLGRIKKRIYPEDITINIGKESPIPEPLVGHKWGKIVHDRHAVWLASWKDTITGKNKYLWLSAESELKANSDQHKFELARKLKKKAKHITEINEGYLKSGDLKTKQIATALYFIDKFAIRVGNEKSEGETDTVGVTNLRIEHVYLHEDNKITLSFLGKDSVPYENTVIVDDIIYKNMKDFIKGENSVPKDKYEQIFDKINSNDVNKYLQSFMKELTAKVYRTYNASNLLQKELRKITKKYETPSETSETSETSSEPESKTDPAKIKIILDEFIKANLKVAKLMNHQKNISKGHKKSVDNVTELINNLKKKLIKARRKTKKNTVNIQKIKDKIKEYKNKKELVKEMKNISLGTSKQNYIDPRIIVAFMKKHNLSIDKLFSKTLQNKFKWAFDVDENFIF